MRLPVTGGFEQQRIQRSDGCSEDAADAAGGTDLFQRVPDADLIGALHPAAAQHQSEPVAHGLHLRPVRAIRRGPVHSEYR